MASGQKSKEHKNDVKIFTCIDCGKDFICPFMSRNIKRCPNCSKKIKDKRIYESHKKKREKEQLERKQKQISDMKEKIENLLDAGIVTNSDIAKHLGISRPTLNSWLNKIEEEST